MFLKIVKISKNKLVNNSMLVIYEGIVTYHYTLIYRFINTKAKKVTKTLCRVIAIKQKELAEQSLSLAALTTG